MEEKIRALLEKEFPDIDFSGDFDLVDDGVIDSLAISVIIAILSIEFDITVPKSEINQDNFNSISAMAAMVKRLSEGE